MKLQNYESVQLSTKNGKSLQTVEEPLFTGINLCHIKTVVMGKWDSGKYTSHITYLGIVRTAVVSDIDNINHTNSKFACLGRCLTSHNISSI